MVVKRKLMYIFWCWLSLILLFMACDDMEDKPFTSGIIGDPTETGTAELYVLCEGLFNQNNSSLARFSFGNQQMVRDYFKAVNHRGIRRYSQRYGYLWKQGVCRSQHLQYSRSGRFSYRNLIETNSDAGRKWEFPPTTLYRFS